MAMLPDISDLFETVCCKECKSDPSESDDFFVMTARGIFCAACLEEKGTTAEKDFVGHVSRQEPPPGTLVEMPVVH